MKSYEFEVVAKNAVIKLVKQHLGLELNIEELEIVWFAHVLGNKKCTLYAERLNNYYPEVTYNVSRNELYVDLYNKEFHDVINSEDFNFNAK